MSRINLQLFAEQAEYQPATGTADTGMPDGAAGDPVAPEGGDQPLSFDELIASNPEYKKALGSHVQDAIAKRFRNQQDLQSQLDSINPILGLLSERYGVALNRDGSVNIAELNEKILDDDSAYEEEAFKRGMTVADLKHMKQLEYQNANLNRAAEARRRDDETRAAYDALLEQGEELKAIYPDFDLGVEMQNPDFGRLVAVDVPVKDAYELIHKDEILAGGMQYAVQETQRKISNSIRSGFRPAENGTGGQSAADPGRVNVSKLTLKDFADIKARAEAGERLIF